MKRTLAVIMAGGKGERLMPLTRKRSKPAIPFGGIYLLIDLALSNCINSGIYKIIVLPQYKSQTLMQHLEGGWNIFSVDLGHYLKIAPPQMMSGEKWYQGTADSIRQNSYLIEEEAPENVLILSGDHVYKMDYARFKSYHEAHDADVTISVIELGKENAGQYGILEVDSRFRVKGFQEKPATPATTPVPAPRDEAPLVRNLTDEEIASFYADNPEMFKNDAQVHARHIITAAGPDADADTVAKARAKAETARKRALAGEDFAELARELSEGPSAPKGGDLGFFSRDQMVPAFADAAFALEPGQISDVVRSGFGFHVIKVEEKRPAGTLPLDEVSDHLRSLLEQQQTGEEVGKMVEALADTATITPLAPPGSEAAGGAAPQ